MPDEAQSRLAYDLLARWLQMKHCPRVMHIGSHRLLADDSVGAWLRCERERRNISIASIAESTKILGALFEGLENDDLSRWPEGFYRRAFVRAYAQAIGLDPQKVVNEFLARFPERPTESDKTGSNKRVTAMSDEPPQSTVLRLTLADTGQWFRPGPRVQAIALRFAAASLDLAVIALLSAALWIVSDPSFALAAVACGYYAASILILGNTPGVCTFAGRRNDNDRGHSLFRRAPADVLRAALASFDRSLSSP